MINIKFKIIMLQFPAYDFCLIKTVEVYNSTGIDIIDLLKVIKPQSLSYSFA